MPIRSSYQQRAGKVSVLGLVVASNLLVLGIVGAVLFVVWPRDRRDETHQAAGSVLAQSAALPGEFANKSDSTAQSVQSPSTEILDQPATTKAIVIWSRIFPSDKRLPKSSARTSTEMNSS